MSIFCGSTHCRRSRCVRPCYGQGVRIAALWQTRDTPAPAVPPLVDLSAQSSANKPKIVGLVYFEERPIDAQEKKITPPHTHTHTPRGCAHCVGRLERIKLGSACIKFIAGRPPSTSEPSRDQQRRAAMATWLASSLSSHRWQRRHLRRSFASSPCDRCTKGAASGRACYARPSERLRRPA